MSNKFETIAKQARVWDTYARIAPIVALGTASVSYYINHNFLDSVILTGIALAITTLIIWWFWAVYAIARLAIWRRDIGKAVDAIEELLKENKKDLKELIQEIKR